MTVGICDPSSGRPAVVEPTRVAAVHSSRLGFVALVVASVFLAAVGIIALGLYKSSGATAITGAVGVGGVLAFVVAFVWPMRYTVNQSGVHIRAGLRTVALRWDQIDRASKRSSSILHGPALAVTRVAITYRNEAQGLDRVMTVSPRDRDAFLADMARESPRHHLDEGALVASPNDSAP